MGLTTPWRVLVLGGTGFVGTPLSDVLRREGHDVRAAGREVDVTDRAAIDAAVAGRDAVFHLAGAAVAGGDPLPTYELNVMGTANVLDACRRSGVARVVVVGSASAYRASAAGCLDEDVPLEGRDAYGASKACADLMTRAYASSFGLPAAVVRPANVYGPGDHQGSRLIPDVLRAIGAGEPPRIRSDGSDALDLVHVDDVVSALVAVARAMDAGAAGRAFNVGGGTAHTIRFVVERLLDLAGDVVDAEFAAPRADGAPRRWLDTTRLRELTGWLPRHDIHAGLRATFEAARVR